MNLRFESLSEMSDKGSIIPFKCLSVFLKLGCILLCRASLSKFDDIIECFGSSNGIVKVNEEGAL